MITHLNKDGNAKMVDVSGKIVTKRTAKAAAIFSCSKKAYDAIKLGTVKKGDILSVAQVAGIMAAKQTSSIIPLCHPLALSHVDISYSFDDTNMEVTILAQVSTTSTTGVEMEALTSASVTALTLYDMVKAIDHSMVIKEVKLLEKSGGKNDYKRQDC